MLWARLIPGTFRDDPEPEPDPSPEPREPNDPSPDTEPEPNEPNPTPESAGEIVGFHSGSLSTAVFASIGTLGICAEAELPAPLPLLLMLPLPFPFVPFVLRRARDVALDPGAERQTTLAVLTAPVAVGARAR
jgi:hypothetical protein